MIKSEYRIKRKKEYQNVYYRIDRKWKWLGLIPTPFWNIKINNTWIGIGENSEEIWCEWTFKRKEDAENQLKLLNRKQELISKRIYFKK